MGRYIEWGDVVNRYNRISDLDGAIEVESAYIVYAEATVEGRLAQKFETPFDSSNLTVKDLSIDLVLAKALMFKNTEKAEAILNSIDDRVKRLLAGEELLIGEGGIALGSDKSVAWSETQGFSPTYGAGDITDMHISSVRLCAEKDARN